MKDGHQSLTLRNAQIKDFSIFDYDACTAQLCLSELVQVYGHPPESKSLPFVLSELEAQNEWIQAYLK